MPGFYQKPLSEFDPASLAPGIRVPEIITSSSLPPFSAASTGSDWGKILGVDPKYNEQIDFGLNRPRPTGADVRKALGWAED
jgi:hypothetical protein